MAETAPWNTLLEHAALSDVGLRRANNQDSFVVVLAGDQREWQERGHLFMIADGMGAHAAGELASKLACNGIAHTYHKLRDRAAPEALRQAIIETNAKIHERGQANLEFHGMGTTTSVLLLLPQGALVGHVGDSRVYRLRNRKIEQLTFDHSLVWEMTASGQLPAGDLANFVPKNIITRSLGPHAEVKVDLEGPFPLEVGDTFLLCSDGLSGQVQDEQIGVIMGSMHPAEAAQALVDLANLNGGPDNVTVIVARVVKPIPATDIDQVFHAPPVQESGFGVQQAAWVAIGVAILVALGLATIGSMVGAIASAGFAVAGAIFSLLYRFNHDGSDPSRDTQGPFGKGPHTTHDATPTTASIEDLRRLVQKLREAAGEQGWVIDWTRFNSLLEEAAKCEAAGNLGEAVRQTTLAISFMMSQIRQQRPPGTTSDQPAYDRS